MPVYFHTEDISFVFKNKRKVSSWLNSVVTSFDKKVGTLNYIFCSDQYLYSINKTYLNHDNFTDIITFNYCDGNKISGDLFISIDRVKEYSTLNNIEFNIEIHRVIVHGVLHLCGYNDKTNAEKRIIKEKENHFLSLII